MIEKGKLSLFNAASRKLIESRTTDGILKEVSYWPSQYPKIYWMLTDTTDFYTRSFDELLRYIKREKRMIIFETPSRAEVTHEYTIEGADSLANGYYFLFNANERLSWLQIRLEDKRVSIASKAKVIEQLSVLLADEITSLSLKTQIQEAEILDFLYENSNGKPCFVEYNKRDYLHQQSLLLSLRFFDSIQNKESKYFKNWWSPLQEKCLTYRYNTISKNANAWFYVKAPSSFVVKVEHDENFRDFIDRSPSNDEEITSLVIMPKGSTKSVDLEIEISVPSALKVWYLGILYLSIATIVFGIIWFVINYNRSDNSDDEFINGCIYAIIASIIATRGWLMAEEQVLKSVSNIYTAIIVVLIAIVIALAFV